MAKLTFRQSEEALDRVGEISDEQGKDKCYIFQELAQKIYENPDDFHTLMDWYESEQTLEQFRGREVSETSVAGVGLVLEGMRSNDIQVIEEGLDRVDSRDYPHFEAQTEAQSGLITKQYQELITGFSDLLEGVAGPKPDRSQAYRGAAKLGVADPAYAEEVLDMLDEKFDEEYWTNAEKLTEEGRELLYEGITGIVKSVHDNNFDEALEYGEGLMRLDQELGDRLAEYIVDESSQIQIKR